MADTQFTAKTVQHIAQLANMPITSVEESKLAAQFAETIDVVMKMSELDTSHTEPTHQVTGLENVWRDDVVQPERTFSQVQALANTTTSYQGYFVVPQVIAQD